MRTLALLVVCLATVAPGLAAPDDQRPSLDTLLSAALNGEPDIVRRRVTTSKDFQALRLGNPRAIERWLGPWHPGKAVLLLDLALASTTAAPQYTGPLLRAGRRYLATRPDTPESAQLARLWHRTALGLLERNGTPALLDAYLDDPAPQSPAGAPADPADARRALVRAVAQEQRCRAMRPEFDLSGVDVRGLGRASRIPVRLPRLPARSALAAADEAWRGCLLDSVTRFDEAASSPDTRAEARVRGAFALVQHGDAERALTWLAEADPRDDCDLAYWAALVRGRAFDMLGRHDEAAVAYRAALDLFPHAQSAGIGLTLALFRSGQVAEADELARALRARTAEAIDPWWIYRHADHRFVERWLAGLREAAR